MLEVMDPPFCLMLIGHEVRERQTISLSWVSVDLDITLMIGFLFVFLLWMRLRGSTLVYR